MVQVTVLILRIYMSLWRENYEMEVVLDQVWNRLSALFGNIFTVQYCNTHMVLTHSLFCMCTSQGQQLKYYTDGSSLLFYLFSWLFFFFLFPCISFICTTPSPTHLGSSSSLRWHPESLLSSFPPLMMVHTSLTLGTLVPPERDSPLGKNPVVISGSVSLGHPRFEDPPLCRCTFWDEGECCWNNTQQDLPIQQSITHSLLVCMHVRLIYRKLILFNYMSVLSMDSTVPAPLFSKMAMNHDLWPRVVCAPNAEQHCHYPILK